MEIVGVIPARLKSTRLPCKLLLPLLGKPLIQWTWGNAKKATLLDKLIIACDDERLRKIVESFGAEVILTSSQHTSGTDRIAEAVREMDVRLVVNIQADEPLIHPSLIDSLIETMKEDSSLVMATAKKKITDFSEIEDPNVVKVVTDKNDFALYFSRLPIPYSENKEVDYYKHIGIYIYTKDFLFTFKNLGPSSLEKTERLEQLRAIEAGYKIKVITTSFECHGVDTEKDLAKVERILRENVRV